MKTKPWQPEILNLFKEFWITETIKYETRRTIRVWSFTRSFCQVLMKNGTVFSESKSDRFGPKKIIFDEIMQIKRWKEDQDH